MLPRLHLVPTARPRYSMDTIKNIPFRVVPTRDWLPSWLISVCTARSRLRPLWSSRSSRVCRPLGLGGGHGMSRCPSHFVRRSTRSRLLVVRRRRHDPVSARPLFHRVLRRLPPPVHGSHGLTRSSDKSRQHPLPSSERSHIMRRQDRYEFHAPNGMRLVVKKRPAPLATTVLRSQFLHYMRP